MGRQASSRSVAAGNTAADFKVLNEGLPRSAGAVDVSRPDIESLILKHYTGLRLLILRRTGDPDVAADLLSEAICITWEKWQANRIESPDRIAGYVFQVAVNLLRNYRRTISNRPQSRVDASQLDEIPDEEMSRNRLIEQEIAAKVRKIIQSMSMPRDREILTRFYLQEEDKESICRDLELDALQFDKVLHRARQRLRKLIETHHLKPGISSCRPSTCHC